MIAITDGLYLTNDDKAPEVYMRYVLGSLLLVGLCLGQAKAPAKSKALTNCQADLSNEALQRIAAESARDELAAENTELETKLAAMTKRYEDAVFVINDIDAIVARTPLPDHVTRLSAVKDGDVLNAGSRLFGHLNKINDAVGALVKHDSMAVEKYNALLADYRQYVERVNFQMSQVQQESVRQQRIANALALYSLMPKYTPVQIPVYQPPPSFNCTSRTSGTTTYTNCN